MDINILAKKQECPGWTFGSPLSGEPSFLAHVMGFSLQLLNGEQLPSPVFAFLCFYTWTRFPKENFLPGLRDKRAFPNSCSPCMSLSYPETLLCRGGGGMYYSIPFCLLCFLMDFQLCRCLKIPLLSAWAITVPFHIAPICFVWSSIYGLVRSIIWKLYV